MSKLRFKLPPRDSLKSLNENSDELMSRLHYQIIRVLTLAPLIIPDAKIRRNLLANPYPHCPLYTTNTQNLGPPYDLSFINCMENLAIVPQELQQHEDSSNSDFDGLLKSSNKEGEDEEMALNQYLLLVLVAYKNGCIPKTLLKYNRKPASAVAASRDSQEHIISQSTPQQTAAVTATVLPEDAAAQTENVKFGFDVIEESKLEKPSLKTHVIVGDNLEDSTNASPSSFKDMMEDETNLEEGEERSPIDLSVQNGQMLSSSTTAALPVDGISPASVSPSKAITSDRNTSLPKRRQVEEARQARKLKRKRLAVGLPGTECSALHQINSETVIYDNADEDAEEIDWFEEFEESYKKLGLPQGNTLYHMLRVMASK